MTKRGLGILVGIAVLFTSIVVQAESTQIERVSKYAVSLQSWQRRAESVRAAILKNADLYPLPERTPINARLSHRRVRSGYSVENVAFEATPGFYVFGNLYRPLRPKKKFPGILVAHGHFKPKSGWFARIAPDNQILCARLAQMGAVVFTYDMVGYGDAKELKHKTKDVLKLQLWDSIRAVDFLGSLPEVDAGRIGVTGASGGATQAILLAAVDARIQASMPVVMVAADYSGNDPCEDGMPIRDVAGQEKSNNTEIAAVIAPKPLMIVSDGADWTKHFSRDEFPYVQQIYRLFGEPDKAQNVHLEKEGHDYGPTKRAIAYRFFSHTLGLAPVSHPEAIDLGEAHVQLELAEDQTVRNWIEIPDQADARGTKHSDAD